MRSIVQSVRDQWMLTEWMKICTLTALFSLSIAGRRIKYPRRIEINISPGLKHAK